MKKIKVTVEGAENHESVEVLETALLQTSKIKQMDGGSVPPAVFFKCSDGNIGVIAANFGNDKEKREVAESIRGVLKKHKAKYCFMVAESWTAPLTPDEYSKWKSENGGKSLEAHPAARSALMITLETCYGNWTGMVEIEKGSKEIDFSNVVLNKQPRDAGFASTFGNLLPMKTVNLFN